MKELKESDMYLEEAPAPFLHRRGFLRKLMRPVLGEQTNRKGILHRYSTSWQDQSW